MKGNSFPNLLLRFRSSLAKRYAAWQVRNVGGEARTSFFNDDKVFFHITLSRLALGRCSRYQLVRHSKVCGLKSLQALLYVGAYTAGGSPIDEPASSRQPRLPLSALPLSWSKQRMRISLVHRCTEGQLTTSAVRRCRPHLGRRPRRRLPCRTSGLARAARGRAEC